LDKSENADKLMPPQSRWQTVSQVIFENRDFQRKLMRGTLDFSVNTDARNTLLKHSVWFQENIDLLYRLSYANLQPFVFHCDQLLALTSSDPIKYSALMNDFLTLLRKLSFLWIVFQAPLHYYEGRLMNLSQHVEESEIRKKFELALSCCYDSPWIEARILIELDRTKEAIAIFEKVGINPIHWLKLSGNKKNSSIPKQTTFLTGSILLFILVTVLSET
jgi:hypothetical protein